MLVEAPRESKINEFLGNIKLLQDKSAAKNATISFLIEKWDLTTKSFL